MITFILRQLRTVGSNSIYALFKNSPVAAFVTLSGMFIGMMFSAVITDGMFLFTTLLIGGVMLYTIGMTLFTVKPEWWADKTSKFKMSIQYTLATIIFVMSILGGNITSFITGFLITMATLTYVGAVTRDRATINSL